jgi:hypothetical protein
MQSRLPSALCLAACTGFYAPSVLAQAAPVCAITGAPSIKGRVRGAAVPLSAAVDAKLGQELEAFLLWPGTLNGRKVVFSDEESDGRVSWTKSGCPPLEISWQRIEPRMAHQNTPAPNPGLRVYANAVIFGPRHGKWIGYDRLELIESPIAQAAAASLTLRDARPTSFAATRPPEHEGLGVMRLAASVRLGAATWKTPGLEDAATASLPPRVFRYSFRAGDGFIGWLTAFYNVPYLFGSAGDGAKNQADLFIGADCADVLVAALRRAGLPRLRYTNVGGVLDQLTRVKKEAVVRPCPPEQPACASPSEPPLRFGTDVRPGDILAVDYLGAGELPRALDHIVVLVSDSGPQGVPDGVLGPHDLVFDSGDERALKLAPLSDQGAVRVVVSRPDVTAF